MTAATFRCLTFGCRVNQYETQAIREQLLQRGYVEAAENLPVDLLVVNTCTVTESADRECLGALRDLHQAHPQAQIVVTGCLVQRDWGRLKELPGVRLLAGNQQKHRIAEWVESLDPWAMEPRLEVELGQIYSPLRISAFEGRSKAFVKVQDGCDRACAFCKIPLVRGRSRSRPLNDLLEEVRRLLDHGFKEVTLTGVALGLWGREWDPSLGLADLVEAVDRIPGRFRVRLSSLDPRDLDDRLVKALGISRKICHHLHLSLQSGSDPVLARMNRGYTTRWYENQVETLRRHWPDLGLTTDLIAGFPGETSKQFEETLRFCRKMAFAKVHVFPYSRRKGTSAWFFKDSVEPPLVRQRAMLLRRVSDEGADRFRRRFIGTDQEVLVEKGEVGYTSQFLRVSLSGPVPSRGELCAVRLTGGSSVGLVGSVVRV